MKRVERQAGFTLLEVALAFSALALLSLVIVESLSSLSRSSALAASQSRLEALADRVIHTAGRDASFAVWVFDKSTESNDYLDAIDFGAQAPVSWSRLPETVADGNLTPDAPGTNQTGNMLFIGRHSDVLTVTLQTAPVENSLVRVDRMRLIVYYLTEHADGSLDLVRWGSTPIARYADLQQVPEGERRVELLAQLLERGVRYAWDPGRPRASGLFSIGTKGLQPLASNARVAGDVAMRTTGLLGDQRTVSVAENNAPQGISVPAYAEPAGRFPAGFEVKAVGVPVSKLVLLRLVIQATTSSMQTSAQAFRTVHCREG